MKKILIIPILFGFLYCTTTNYKKELEGEWYYENFPNNTLIFEKDSMWINSIVKTGFKWVADASTIHLHNPRRMDPRYFNNDFNYVINHDTLSWVAIKDTTETVYKLIRIRDKYKHFGKTIGLKIDLPHAKEKLIPINPVYNYLNIFIGLKNGEMILKGNDKLMKLNHFPTFVMGLRLQFDENEFKNKFIFNMYADKNITEAQMDTIKKILEKLEFNRVFRIYRNDSINYKNNLNWYGKYE